MEKESQEVNGISFMLAIRNNVFNVILYAMKLFQQYLVDAYVKIENDRMVFIRMNQAALKSENYNMVFIL